MTDPFFALNLPPLPREDGQPSRETTTLNVRREENAVLDHLLSFWRLQEGSRITKVDAFSRVLAAAVENPKLHVPPGLRRRVLERR